MVCQGTIHSPKNGRITLEMQRQSYININKDSQVQEDVLMSTHKCSISIGKGFKGPNGIWPIPFS